MTRRRDARWGGGAHWATILQELHQKTAMLNQTLVLPGYTPINFLLNSTPFWCKERFYNFKTGRFTLFTIHWLATYSSSSRCLVILMTRRRDDEKGGWVGGSTYLVWWITRLHEMTRRRDARRGGVVENNYNDSLLFESIISQFI